MKRIGIIIFNTIFDLIDVFMNMIDFLTPFFITIVTVIYMLAWTVTWPLRLVLWLAFTFLTIITSPFKEFQAYNQENALFFKNTLVIDRKNKNASILNKETAAEGASPIIRSASGIDNDNVNKEINDVVPDVDVDVDADINIDLNLL